MFAFVRIPGGPEAQECLNTLVPGSAHAVSKVMITEVSKSRLSDTLDRVTGEVPTRRAQRLHASALALMFTDRSARGIADRLGDLIHSGEIAQGLRLPTVRALAAALHVGPTTIASAWAQLRQRGLIH
ncbi:GntR family transcriptional regulator, partial [Micromonospora azadirachtae]